MRPERLRCGDAEYDPDHRHLPATYNPWHDVTSCLCGVRWWDGITKTAWKSVERLRPPAEAREIPRGVGMGANGITDRYESTGWDTYELTTDTEGGE